nr:hypothetical protein [uncultured Faecalibacillus sp.]
MFKYKDLRMVVISIILVVLCVFCGIHFRYDRMKLIIVLLLALSVIPTLIVRFNASVFEDGMLIYTFRGIAILPQMIEFKDLASYKLLSKHVLELQSQNKTQKIYLVNAIAFYKELDDRFIQYKNGQEI